MSDVTDSRTVSITSASLGQRSARVTGLPSGGLCDRVCRRVEVHRAGKGVSDDERRRGEVVEADLVVDAPLEVAVAGEHGGNGQATLFHRFGHAWQQRSGVSDARRAAEADELETEGLQWLEQVGSRQVVHDDA